MRAAPHTVSIGCRLVETAKSDEAPLFRGNQRSAFEYAERRAALSARITACVNRAFYAIGASSATQEVIYWNLSVTKNVGRNEVADKPGDFIEGLRAIYGEAGCKVFEYMLGKEIRREFNLTFPLLDAEREGEAAASRVPQLITYLLKEP